MACYRADPDFHARRLSRLVVLLARGAADRSRPVRIMPEFLKRESPGEVRAPG